MIFVPRNTTNEQVLDIVRNWIDILSTADYQAAFAAIATGEVTETWTPYFLEIAIKGYRSPEYYPGIEDFRVTDWRTAHGGNSEPLKEVVWYQSNGSGLRGYVRFDLPVNGQWSDLAAEFNIWNNDNLEEGFLFALDEIGCWEQRQREWAAEETAEDQTAGN